MVAVHLYDFLGSGRIYFLHAGNWLRSHFDLGLPMTPAATNVTNARRNERIQLDFAQRWRYVSGEETIHFVLHRPASLIQIPNRLMA